MIHMTKQLDLTESPLRIDLVIERIRYLLNRHVLARLRIQSRATKPQNSDSKTQTQKENQRNQREREREREIPNDAVCAFSNRHNGRLVLSGDFKDVAEDVVLNKSPSVT